MDTFKIWMLSLCGATAITSLFKILLSGSTLNKVLNVFFSIFILFYTVMPLQSFFNNTSIKTEYENTEIEYSDIYKNGYEQLIEISIGNVCDKLSVDVLDMKIESYIDDNGYLCIEYLEIDIDNKEKSAEVQKELKNQLGFEVLVK